jgi:hypothetical protein
MHRLSTGFAFAAGVLAAPSVFGQTGTPTAGYPEPAPTGAYGNGGSYGQASYPPSGGGTAPGYGNGQSTGAPTGNGLEAGGLTPPTTNGEDAATVQTEQKLDDADKQDSGRGLEFFYMNGELGFESLGLDTLHANNLVNAASVHTAQTGFLYGAGLGLRLLFLTIGPRFRMGMFGDYNLWTLGGELGLRIPIGRVEPYLMLGAGYASLSGLNTGELNGVNSSNVAVRGFDVRAGGGVDVYVTPVFSVGVNLTGDVLVLSRPGVGIQTIQNATSGSAPQTPQQAQQREAQLYAVDGSSIGLGFTGTVVLGLHF